MPGFGGTMSVRRVKVDCPFENFATTEPQNENDSATEHQLESRPKHAHETNEFQAAANVLVVLLFERCYLGFFLDVGANEASTGEVFLRTRRNVGEHRLNAFEALVDAASEGLDHNADRGQRQKSEQRQPRTDRNHERQSACGVDDGVGRIHDRGTQQHAYCIQIVSRARHNVARAIALVVGVAQTFEAGEKVVAKVELNVARDADHDPSREVLKDTFREGDGQQHSCPEKKLMARDASV